MGRCVSEVQATTRPRPCCQCASSGSPLSEVSAVTARGRARRRDVAASVGRVAPVSPSMIGLGAVTCGSTRPSTIELRVAIVVSRDVMRGTSAERSVK